MSNKARYVDIGRFFPVFILILMLFCSHDTLLFGTNKNELFISICEIIPFAIIAMTVPYVLSLQFIDTKKMIPILLLVFLPFLSCIVNKESYNNYIYRAAIIIASAFLVLLYDYKRIFHIYNKIMKFLAIWSCVVWLISLLSPEVIELFPVINNSQSLEYHFLGFSNVCYIEGLSRNLSIFREPGVYVIFLVIALIAEIHILDNKKKKLNLIIYCVALFTTFSTAGYILLFILAIYYLFIKHDSKREAVFIIGTIIIGFVMANQFGMLDVLFEKFSYGTNTYGSWLARLSSLTKNIEISFKNPFFGIGRYALYDTTLAVDGTYTSDANTNTILIGSAAYGLLFGGLCLFSCLRFSYVVCGEKILSTVIISLILLAALSNEDMGQNYVYYIIIFLGLFTPSETVEKEIEKKV